MTVEELIGHLDEIVRDIFEDVPQNFSLLDSINDGMANAACLPCTELIDKLTHNWECKPL